MQNAKIAAREPVEVGLEAGEHYWCACGRSKNQPFCDGSHQGTGIEPLAFTVKEKGKHWLCLCKQTGTAPFCNGNHNSLPADVTEMPAPSRT